jgi:hypothetical protein
MNQSGNAMPNIRPFLQAAITFTKTEAKTGLSLKGLKPNNTVITQIPRHSVTSKKPTGLTQMIDELSHDVDHLFGTDGRSNLSEAVNVGFMRSLNKNVSATTPSLKQISREALEHQKDLALAKGDMKTALNLQTQIKALRKTPETTISKPSELSLKLDKAPLNDPMDKLHTELDYKGLADATERLLTQELSKPGNTIYHQLADTQQHIKQTVNAIVNDTHRPDQFRYGYCELPTTTAAKATLIKKALAKFKAKLAPSGQSVNASTLYDTLKHKGHSPRIVPFE